MLENSRVAETFLRFNATYNGGEKFAAGISKRTVVKPFYEQYESSPVF